MPLFIGRTHELCETFLRAAISYFLGFKCADYFSLADQLKKIGDT